MNVKSRVSDLFSVSVLGYIDAGSPNKVLIGKVLMKSNEIYVNVITPYVFLTSAVHVVIKFPKNIVLSWLHCSS